MKTKVKYKNLLVDGYNAVFVATGLWDGTALFDKKPAGVYASVRFLASPHVGQLQEVANDVEGNRVAVIGGGSVAMDCASYALELGATDVFLVYRRSYGQMPADEEERLKALENGIHFMLLNQPKAYVTDSHGRVSGLELVRTALSAPESGKRRSPVEVAGSNWVLNVNCVIEAIGNKAFDDSPKIYPDVTVDAKNLIKASVQDCKTSVSGIFAGGDIVRGPSLVVNAVQDGKIAAGEIDSYLAQREA